MKEEKISVIVVEPGKNAYKCDIINSLDSMQTIVDGWVECIYPFDDDIAIVCNEEGKNNGMKLNRALFDEDGELYDIIAGTFIVAAFDDQSGEFRSLTENEAEEYYEMYREAEMFIGTPKGIKVLKYDGWM